MKKKIIFPIIMLLLLMVAIVTVTFAAFTFTKEGTVENTLETGTVTLTYTEGKTGIMLNEAYPMSDERGKMLTGENNVFDFTVQANLSRTMSIGYEVTAVKIPINYMTPLEDNEVKLYLERAIDPDTTYQEVLSPSNFVSIESQTKVGSPIGSMILDSGAFYQKGTTIYNYRLRLWVDENTEIPSGESRKYGVKVNVYAKQLLSDRFTDESCFTFDASTGTITDYSDTCPKDVVIPYTIDGVLVTTIGNRSRGGNAFYNKQITSVVIPNSVTHINFLSFNNNQLPDEQAFIYQRNADGSIDYTTLISYGGAKRDNVIIPDSVTSIANSAFQYTKLASVIIPDSVTVIGEQAFYRCELTNLTISKNIVSIGRMAFTHNQLPDTQAFIYKRNEDGSIDYTTLIGYGGANLDHVVIPNDVVVIDSYAFRGSNLTNVTLPNSVTNILDHAFELNMLTNITIPNSITTIGESAFFSNQLTSVIIPDSVTSIGESAFSSNQLTTVTIGKGVINIENFAFRGNPTLTKIVNLTGRAFKWNVITQNGASGQEVPFVTGKTSTGIIISAS